MCVAHAFLHGSMIQLSHPCSVAGPCGSGASLWGSRLTMPSWMLLTTGTTCARSTTQRAQFVFACLVHFSSPERTASRGIGCARELRGPGAAERPILALTARRLRTGEHAFSRARPGSSFNKIFFLVVPARKFRAANILFLITKGFLIYPLS